MALTGAQRQKKWRESNRALWNLRRRNLRKNLDLGEKEPEREATVPSTEMTTEVQPMGDWNHVLEPTPPRTPMESKDETLAQLREMVKQEQEKPIAEVPESMDTRSRSDIAMGIWRNDQGGVISKFAYDKLQKLKKKAETGGYEIDDYSQ